ncbi:hypothetical protein BHM03_00045759, partial [Ensete ventricosum]
CGATHRWRLPYPRAASSTIGTAAPMGDGRRCPSGSSSCRHCARRHLPCKITPSPMGAQPLQALAMPVGGRAYWRLPLAGWPQAALATCDRP